MEVVQIGTRLNEMKSTSTSTKRLYQSILDMEVGQIEERI